MTSNTEQFKKISTVKGIQKVMDEVLGAQTIVENTSGIEDDPDFNADEEHEAGQMITNYINHTLNHLIKLKTRLNTFVPINKLPSELLSYIILFAGPSLYRSRHPYPYMFYTRVCRHWRSVLVQEPRIWASFQFASRADLVHPFFPQLIKLSKGAKLNITIGTNFKATSELGDFFAVESNRIRRLWIWTDVTDSLSRKPFPSLREVTYNASLLQLLPFLTTTDRLETLKGVLREIPRIDAINQLSLVFSRIRNLDLSIGDTVAPFILDLLNDCVKLQNLRLNVDTAILIKPDYSRQTILPELEFLSIDYLRILENFRAPKISAIYADWCTPSIKPILEKFDFSSIRYLYISGENRDRVYSVVGLKQPHSRSLFSIEHSEIKKWIDSLKNEIFLTSEDLQFGPYFPENCFCFVFAFDTAFIQALLSQMTSLVQLYISIDGYCVQHYVDAIITQVPFVEKLVVVAEGFSKFIHRLSNPALCPRLKHLTYRAPFLQRLQLDEEGGKFLAECLQSRHKVHGPVLTRIDLEVCPSLSDMWLRELQELGTTVVTKEK